MVQRLALLIGVRQFEDPHIKPLNAPDQDVRALDAVLRNPAIGGFDRVDLCLDEPYNSVRDKIFDLMVGRDPSDLILLYYSGHGVLDFEGHLHLLTRNSRLDRIRAASFRSDEIRDWLNGSRSRRQVLVLDCCYAGAFAEDGYKGGGRPAVTEATFDPRGYGRVVMMASSALQPIPDGAPGAGSISHFTGFLVEGLRDGLAAPDDPEVTAQALAAYAETKMRRERPGIVPRIQEDNQAGPIVLARNPQAGITRIPAELRHALADVDPLRRGGAIARLTALMESEDALQAQAARRLLRAQVRNEHDADLRDFLRSVPGLTRCKDAALESERPERLARLGERERAGTPGPSGHARDGRSRAYAAMAALALLGLVLGGVYLSKGEKPLAWSGSGSAEGPIAAPKHPSATVTVAGGGLSAGLPIPVAGSITDADSAWLALVSADGKQQDGRQPVNISGGQWSASVAPTAPGSYVAELWTAADDGARLGRSPAFNVAPGPEAPSAIVTVPSGAAPPSPEPPSATLALPGGGLRAGTPIRLGGSITSADSAWVALVSSDGKQQGARQTATVSGGKWSASVTPAAPGSFVAELWTEAGDGTRLARSAGFNVAPASSAGFKAAPVWGPQQHQQEDQRCRNLRDRFQLGEELSNADRSYLQTGCGARK